MAAFLLSVLILCVLIGLLVWAFIARQNRRRPLHIAAASGDVEAVLTLLFAGADVEAKFLLGYTPLHVAAYRGRTECVMALLHAGSNIEARDKKGYTPLHMAARWGNAETIYILLDAGADANTKNSLGKTPLDYVKQNKKLDDTGAYWRLENNMQT